MSINLDEIERARKLATRGRWRVGFADGSGSGEDGEGFHITARRGVDVIVRGGRDSWGVPHGVTYPNDAYLIVLLHNNASELLRLARIGQATEAEGKGEGA